MYGELLNAGIRGMAETMHRTIRLQCCREREAQQPNIRIPDNLSQRPCILQYVVDTHTHTHTHEHTFRNKPSILITPFGFISVKKILDFSGDSYKLACLAAFISIYNFFFGCWGLNVTFVC